MEVWFQPANLTQEGPARLFTISGDTSNCNVTLGQKGPRCRRACAPRAEQQWHARHRDGRLLKTALTHAVYPRDAAGKTRLFVNGRLAKEQSTPGTISNWNGNYRLALGNEFSGDRAWRGTLNWVAVYGRSLSAAEVIKLQGWRLRSGGPRRGLAVANEALFETKIAPLLAKHCLDATTPPRPRAILICPASSPPLLSRT